MKQKKMYSNMCFENTHKKKKHRDKRKRKEENSFL